MVVSSGLRGTGAAPRDTDTGLAFEWMTFVKPISPLKIEVGLVILEGVGEYHEYVAAASLRKFREIFPRNSVFY